MSSPSNYVSPPFLSFLDYLFFTWWVKSLPDRSQDWRQTSQRPSQRSTLGCGPQAGHWILTAHRRPSKDYQPHRSVTASLAITKSQANQLSQKEDRSGLRNNGVPGTQMPQSGLYPFSICVSLNNNFILLVPGFWEDEILATGNSGLYLNKLLPKKG